MQIFDIMDYMTGQGGSDENADVLTNDLRKFMLRQNSAAAANMHVPAGSSNRESTAGGGTSKEPTAGACGEIDDQEGLLVDESDRRRKNVDSGKVAILMTTDSVRELQGEP